MSSIYGCGFGLEAGRKEPECAQDIRTPVTFGASIFGEFLSAAEVFAGAVLPVERTAAAYCERQVELALGRLPFLGERTEEWWLGRVPFFDVERERIWIFWRRVLHTAHHRTQLTMYLRMLGRQVPAIYGPSADQSWSGADPTNTVEAAGRG